MTTLIHVGNSQGTVGRCDAKCYDAEGGDCSCICGGINHGKGLEQACENTLSSAKEQIKAIQDRERNRPIGYPSPARALRVNPLNADADPLPARLQKKPELAGPIDSTRQESSHDARSHSP